MRKFGFLFLILVGILLSNHFIYAKREDSDNQPDKSENGEEYKDKDDQDNDQNKDGNDNKNNSDDQIKDEDQDKDSKEEKDDKENKEDKKVYKQKNKQKEDKDDKDEKKGKKSQQDKDDDENKEKKKKKKSKKKEGDDTQNEQIKKKVEEKAGDSLDQIQDSLVNIGDNISAGLDDAFQLQNQEQEFFANQKTKEFEKGLHKNKLEKSTNLGEKIKQNQKRINSSSEELKQPQQKVGVELKETEIQDQSESKEAYQQMYVENTKEYFQENYKDVIEYIFQKDDKFVEESQLSINKIDTDEDKQKLLQTLGNSQNDNSDVSRTEVLNNGINSDVSTLTDSLSQGISDLGHVIVNPSEIFEDASDLTEESLEAPGQVVNQTQNAAEQLQEMTDGSAEALVKAPIDTVKAPIDYVDEQIEKKKETEITKNKDKTKFLQKNLPYKKKSHKQKCDCKKGLKDCNQSDQKFIIDVQINSQQCGCGGTSTTTTTTTTSTNDPRQKKLTIN